MTTITHKNFPEAFAAMDEAARDFWAYPDESWQAEFLRQWAQENNVECLLQALGA